MERQLGNTGAGGAGSSSTLTGLERLDTAWGQLKEGSWKREPKPIVFTKDSNEKGDSSSAEYDIIVCGGTLGVFYAAAMKNRGYKVAVVERNKVSGRSQEWNISKKELKTLVRMGLLTEDEIETIIGIEFNPVRVGFKTDTSPDTKTPGFEVYVNDGKPYTSYTRYISYILYPIYLIYALYTLYNLFYTLYTSVLNIGVKPDVLIQMVRRIR